MGGKCFLADVVTRYSNLKQTISEITDKVGKNGVVFSERASIIYNTGKSNMDVNLMMEGYELNFVSTDWKMTPKSCQKITQKKNSKDYFIYSCDTVVETNSYIGVMMTATGGKIGLRIL
ncbi:UNKNOWN [Stylonychia lemnae]|uniref:Uncharacterized protein n=1 Tax=Stylonychia lemnae TaxID=5949 RepID=A0A077ZU86_STYLE|nr:UNKNOWN [Stylonychia lemnae]|eukprot:CDW72850.1 UNKNOWN [Stylonychia lemnae]